MYGKSATESHSRKKELIVNFVITQIAKGYFPSRADIERSLSIDLRTYFGNLWSVYECAGLSYEKVKKMKSEQKGRFITNSKRRFSVDEGRKQIATFLVKAVEKGRFPGYNEIQEQFGISLQTYFNSTSDAYRFAQIDCQKRPINPFISLEKEKKLVEISKKLLCSLDFEILRCNHNKGADLVVMDKEGNIIPVELKAYHRNVNIPIGFFGHYETELKQLQQYIEQHQAPYGILITTTDRINAKIPENIVLLNGRVLRKKLIEEELTGLLPSLDWIRNTYCTSSKQVEILKKRNKIANYIISQVALDHYPSMRETESILKLNVRTYFPENMLGAYRFSEVKLPCRYLSKQKATEEIAGHVRREVKNGKYPSLERIEQQFHISLRTYFDSPRQMFELAGVEAPRRFLDKTGT
ncbi:MAG: hypothetical protein V1493_04215 [Candidatus Diapherotrites archaeon]